MMIPTRLALVSALSLCLLGTSAAADTESGAAENGPATTPTAPTAPPSGQKPQARIPNLAVLAFTGNAGTDPEDLKAVAGRLESELMRTGSFRVVERRNVDAILREQGFQESGACNTSDCQVEVGQILGVERIVSGELTHMGKLWSLTVRQVDVGTGALVTSHVLDIQGSLETVLRGGCPQMADILSGRSKPTENRTVLQEKSNNTWMWIAGGAAIATGGVVAAILLSRDQGTTTQEPTPTREVEIIW